MATIALEQINKLYPNGFHAVKNLDLDVRDGETARTTCSSRRSSARRP
jgi:hypothetical protein